MDAIPNPVPEKETSRRRTISLSITSVLVSGSAGATMLAVGIVLFLGLTSTLSNTRTLLFRQSEQLIESLMKDVVQELHPIQTQVAWVEQKVRTGEIDPRNPEEWLPFVASVPAATPQINTLGFVDTNMQALIYEPRSGETEFKDFSENTRVVDLIQGLSKTMKPQWLPPLLLPGGQYIDLLIWVPLFRNGGYIGVYFQTVAATALTQRAGESALGAGTIPFIIYDNNWLLAHPNLPEWHQRQLKKRQRPEFQGQRGRLPLPALDELDDPVIARIWSGGPAFIDRADGKSLTRVTKTEINDVRYIYVTQDISDYGAKPWTIGAYFGEDQASEVISEIFQVGVGGLLVLVLATALAIFVGRRTVRPIHRLANAARRVQDGDLQLIDVLPPSSLRELDEASNSFNQMVKDLRDKERIRNLFGKYVPETVAERLLAQEGDLKPQHAVATILFVDLVGFTELSEKIKPEEIVCVLNKYFSDVVEVIERCGGVITQFQGDAILAIFNVPVADPRHAGQAVAAAREIHDTVDNRLFGGHQLTCRVGINTGEVIAGNVGAQGRMNYTVHGDAVNVAARLEQLNKEKGTATLVSQNTVDEAPEERFKKIGEVTVRGKTHPIGIYTLENRPNIKSATVAEGGR